MIQRQYISFSSRLFFILFVALFATNATHAQRKWFANGGIGALNYYGDLQEKTFTTIDMHMGFNLGLTRQFSPHILANFSMMFGKLSANDANNGPRWSGRNLNFQTGIFEAALTAEYDFINILEPDDGNLIDNNERRFTPYVFAGLGFFHVEPYTYDLSGKRVELRRIGTEAQEKPYSAWQVSVPMGVGFKYQLTSTVQVGAEVSFRKTLTDYMDDVSKNQYPDTALLLITHGPEAASLSYRADEIPNNDYKFYGYRGNPKKNDGFYSIMLRVGVELFVYKPKFYYGY